MHAICFLLSYKDVRSKWLCCYSVIEDRLYMKEGNRWRAYRPTGRTQNRKFTITDFIYDDLPDSTHRTATYSEMNNPNSISMESYLSWQCQDSIVNPADHDPYKGPFTQLQYAFDDWIACRRILIDEIRIPNDNCIAIANSIRDGSACLISDVSYFPDYDSSSSAFILTPEKTKKNELVWLHWVPGSKEDQNPYRSELAGINGALSMIVVLVQFFESEQGTIEIALDGESAMNRAKKSVIDLLINQLFYNIL